MVLGEETINIIRAYALQVAFLDNTKNVILGAIGWINAGNIQQCGNTHKRNLNCHVRKDDRGYRRVKEVIILERKWVW